MVADTGRLCRAKSETRIPLGVSWNEIAKERERMAEKYVFIIDLADYMGRTTTAVQSKATRMKIPITLVRRSVSGKAALAVTVDDAKRIMTADVKLAETVKPKDLI
jgi:hypothetical protein